MNANQCQQHYRELRDGAALAAGVIVAIARDEAEDLVAADCVRAIRCAFRQQFGRVVMTDGFSRGQRCGLVAIEQKLDRIADGAWAGRFEQAW